MTRLSWVSRPIGVGAAIALLALSLLPSPAVAQDRGRFGGMGRGERVELDFQRRDLPIMVETLDLDASQKTIVEVLMLDLIESFNAVSDEMRARQEALREDRSPEQQQQQETQREQMRGSFAEMRELRQTLGDLEGRNVSPEIVARLESRLAELQGQMETTMTERFQSEEFQRRQEAQAQITREWKAQRDRLHASFVADVQGILNEDQYDRWPAFERKLRRLNTMSRGRLMGENVDLFILVRDLRITPEQAPDLPALLDSYAAALDQALLARNAHLDASSDAMGRAFRAQDTDQIAALAQREAGLRVRVRAVNEQAVDAIAAALGEDGPGAEFRLAFRRKAFARVYRPTSMERSFDAVQKFENLDEEILAAVAELEAAYRLELADRNEGIVRVTRREEPKQMVERAGRMRRGFGGNRDEQAVDPVRVAYTERDEMDRRYRTQLESMLTREQVAALPALRDSRRDGRRGGFADRMAEMDANGDGKLQRTEVPERMQGFFDRMDANGDGALDESEMENFGGRRGGRGGEGRGPGGPGGPGGRERGSGRDG